MRLWALMNALAFRGAKRIVPGSDQFSQVRQGVDCMLHIFRPEIEDSCLSDDVNEWAEQIVSWQPNVPSVDLLRKIWTSTVGGFGARDIWDLTRALSDRPVSSDLFIVAACLPAIASVALGGSYGASVAMALSSGLRKHLPSALVSAGDLRTAADSHVSSSVVEEPVSEICRRYLLQLAFGVTMPREKLYAGVLNHFLNWCGEHSDTNTATADQVIEEMEKHSVLARKYLNACDGTSTINVHRGPNKDVESVVTTMRLGNGVSKQQKQKQVVMMDGGVHAVFRYAEDRWEAGIRVG